jgi:hypothetical protein
MKLARFNQLGLTAFNAYLDSLETTPTLPPPFHLLEDATHTEMLAPTIEVEPQDFDNRFSAAAYLFDKLSALGPLDIDRDKGLWAWLTLLYFDAVCPVEAGSRSPGERARYIPAFESYTRYYRHLLASPYRIYKAHRDNPERAMAVLAGLLNAPGDIAEQLAARQEMITNKTLMETATRLYIDPATKKAKRGAGGKSAGSARRLADVTNQFDVTWDLYAMQVAEFLGVLPKEFNRFKATA